MGKDIKELRESLGLTQKEFANRLKVDVRTISRWENNESRPTKKALRAIERQRNKSSSILRAV